MTDEQAATIARRAAESAAPEMEALNLRLASKYHIDQVTLSQTDMKRLGLFLCEIQEETLAMGIKTGLKMVEEFMKELETDE